MRRDPLIIGAGPAGSAAAITLATAGYRPTLIERTTGPTHKVCGDFLSLDTIQRAQALGVDPMALGAAPIHRVRLIHGERTAESDLPFPAFGLSRRTFDAALQSRAESAGSIVQTGQTIRHLTRDKGDWTAQTGDQTVLTAETIFLATGKHDLRNLPRPHTDRGAIGMKMYFALAPSPAKTLNGAIELTLFPGGYAGMQHRRKRPGGPVHRRPETRVPALWRQLARADRRHRATQPTFRRNVGRCPPAAAPPLAVAGIPYGYQADPRARTACFDSATRLR